MAYFFAAEKMMAQTVIKTGAVKQSVKQHC